ncbi:MAG: hypothetical protein MK108_13550 [Mariniblastus sp.]|nr:hypothetical protein [Mariniblastus sp.]
MKGFSSLFVLVVLGCTLGCVDSAQIENPSDVEPLQVVLTDSTAKKTAGTPLFFDLRLENRSDRPIPVAELGNVLLGAIGPDGEPMRWLDDVVDYDDVPVEDWDGTVLEPGDWIGKDQHGPLHFSETGEYTLWVTYHGPGFQDGVESNRITFTIE